MLELLLQPTGIRWTLALMHFLWQGAAIAALLAAALKILPHWKSPARYALSMAALALMAVCPIVTFYCLGSSTLPCTKFEASNALSSYDDSLNPSASMMFVPEAYESRTLHIGGLSSPTVSEFAQFVQPYVLTVWLGGVWLLAGRLLLGYLGTLWLKGACEKLPTNLSVKISDLGKRLGVPTRGRVFGCARVPEALAIGFWKPIVLVPMSWLAELPPHVIEAVIAHELAHIRRWDLWATLLQRLIETLLFYHPAVWWLSQRVTLEREMCCDELAVAATGRRVAYAKVLQYLGERAVGSTPLVLATSFNGGGNMNLLTRVRHVLGLQPQPESGRVWLAGVLSAGMALGMLAVSSTASRQSAMADEPGRKPAEGEGRRSAEAEAGPRRSAEGEGVRRSAEGERPVRRAAEGEGVRRPAEGEGVRRPAEGEGVRRPGGEGERSRAAASALDNFKPQTDREAVLYQMIMQLRNETNSLREQMSKMRGEGRAVGAREGEARRDGEVRREGTREGDERRPVARDGEGAPRTGPRDGEVRREGARDGDVKKTGPRDGEVRREGARDGEGERRGPRDGEGDKPRSERDGDKPKAEGDKPKADG